MFKTFIAGILLGIVAAGAALYYVPAVNQFREHSMIVVHPNHGNTESFHINVPMDRIMIGAPAQDNPLPAGMVWPGNELFADARAELFKIRNGKDAVIGVGSRIAASHEESGQIVEWVLHLPARGSAYVAMRPAPADGGYRIGELLAGTHEFELLHGRVTERWVADTSGFEDAPLGRIEIITAFVAGEAAGE
jgi:hypothetical protein